MTRTARDASARRWSYVPALDGLRGLSVLGPVLFHARATLLPGGFLTIDLFFVLSSFLIVSIALHEWDSTGRIDLLAYAGRRARRLLPALALCVLALSTYLALHDDPLVVTRWTGGIIAALTYSTNWYEIFRHVSYFDQFANPSPLYHTWSLAIEEQFYLAVPFVVLGALWLGRRTGQVLLLVGGVAAAVASALWMAHLYTGGDPSRVYYGTDTRAQGLLVGIALAVAVRMWGPVRTRAGRAAAVAGGYLGAAWVVYAVTHLDQRRAWLFDRGGFLALAVASGAVVFAVMQPSRSPLHLVLEASPVRFLGRITYGVYLYHWPIFLVIITPRRLESSGWWIVAGVALSIAVATLSYVFVEQPIIKRRFPIVRRPLQPLPAAFAGLVTLGCIVAGLFAAGPSTSPAEARPAVRADDVIAAGADTRAADVRALRVLVVGDSLMTQVGSGLADYAAAHPEELSVLSYAQLGCPVARGGILRPPDGDPTVVPDRCNDWAEAVEPAHVTDPGVASWTTAVATFRPDVVLTFATPWDVADRKLPQFGESWTHLLDPAYDNFVRDEYRQATQVLGGTGARVLWLESPHLNRPVRPQNDPARIDRLNELLHEATAGMPNVELVDYPGWLGPVGSPRERRLRADGVHLSPEGREQIVDWLRNEVLSVRSR